MKKITIIDAYDYVVDMIEDIAYVLNTELYVFTKEKTTNDEVANILIEFMSREVLREKGETVKQITNDLMVKRENKIDTRKLAIQINDNIVNVTNDAISTILSEGYKKIPSRTMFFRESLRVFYNIFHSSPYSEGKVRYLNLVSYEFRDLFLTKIFGPLKGDLWSGKSFWGIIDCRNLYTLTLYDVTQVGDIIIKLLNKRGNTLEFNINDEFFYKIMLDKKKRSYGDLTFIYSNDKIEIKGFVDSSLKHLETRLEIPIKKIDELIGAITPECDHCDNKNKLFLLIIFIRKSIFRFLLKFQLLTGTMSGYNVHSAIDLSEMLIIPYEYYAVSEIEKQVITYSEKNNDPETIEMAKKLKDILTKINEIKLSLYIWHGNIETVFGFGMQWDFGLIFYDALLTSFLLSHIDIFKGEELNSFTPRIVLKSYRGTDL